MKRMKNLVSMTLLTIIVSLFLSSCGGKDPIVPGGGGDDGGDGNHGICWSYNIGIYTLDDITPALDDNDNIYFSMLDMETGTVAVISLDKNGNELWRKSIDEAAETDKAIYYKEKVFVSTSNPSGIYCYDAASGNLLWSKNLTEEYDFAYLPRLVLTNDKVYIFSGQFLYGYLLTYDLDGNEIYLKQLPVTGSPVAASAFGNKLYTNDGQYLYCYTDTGNSLDSTWTYQYGANFKSADIVALFSLPVDDNGNVYIREENIWVVSPQGDLVRTIEPGADYNQSTGNILLSSQGEIFIADNDGNLVKMNNDGSVVWKTDIHDGLIVNPYFSSPPVISNDGTMYDGQSFGLYSINPNGTLNWKMNAETGGGTESGNLHTPVLTHEGNIIIVSGEQKAIRCFKGDGHKLAASGWPKVFGNYGNTGAK